MGFQEAKVQKRVVSKLIEAGAKVIKIITASKAGEADLVVCYKGYFLQLEVKDPNNKVRRKLQTYKLKETRECRGYSFYIDDSKDVAKVLKAINNKKKPKKLPLEAKNLKD